MNVNPWSVSIPTGMLMTSAITLISRDPVPPWGFFLFLAVYTLLIRFAPAVIPALRSGFSTPLRLPRRTASSGRLDIAAARRESYALGLPFPESDGTLSWPPELRGPVMLTKQQVIDRLGEAGAVDPVDAEQMTKAELISDYGHLL